MLITSDELADIVRRASYGAAPSEQELSSRVARAISAARQSTDTSNESSRFLRSLVDKSAEFLTDAARAALTEVELYGADFWYANALPTLEPRRRIIVFDGLQQLFVFYADIIRVLDALQIHRPNATAEIGNETMLEVDAFSLSAFSILSDSLTNLRQPIVIHDMLGPKARAEVMSAYQLGMTFVLLHELGHIELGHVNLSTVRSERAHIGLAISEELDAFQRDELAADAYAFGLLPPRLRGEYLPSVMFLLGGFAFLESIAERRSTRHPLAANRLHALLELSEMNPNDRQMVRNWIDDQIESWRRFESSRSAIGREVHAHIENRVPVKVAYETIRRIKAKVSSEHGFLERGNLADLPAPAS